MVLPDLVLLRCLTHVGDVCTLETSGTIQHDKSVKFKTVIMNKDTKQLVISNLHCKYNICVIRKVFRLECTPRTTLASATRTQFSVQWRRLPGLKRRLRMTNKPLI